MTKPTPVILDAKGELLFFRSAAHLEAYVEATDVTNGEYGPCWDPDGRLYELRVETHNTVALGVVPLPMERVLVVPVEEQPNHRCCRTSRRHAGSIPTRLPARAACAMRPTRRRTFSSGCGGRRTGPPVPASPRCRMVALTGQVQFGAARGLHTGPGTSRPHPRSSGPHDRPRVARITAWSANASRLSRSYLRACPMLPRRP